MIPVNQPGITYNERENDLEIEHNKQEDNRDLESLTLVELKEECKKRGLTGYSSLNKSELVNLLIEEK